MPAPESLLSQRMHVNRWERPLQNALHDSDVYLLWNRRLGYWQVNLFTPGQFRLPIRQWGAELCEDPKKPVPWWHVLCCIRPRSLMAPAGGLLIPGMGRRGDRPYVRIDPGEWLIRYLKGVSVRTREDINIEQRYDSSKFWEWAEKHNKEIEAEIDRKDLDDYMAETIPEALAVYHGKKYFIPKRVRVIDGLL